MKVLFSVALLFLSGFSSQEFNEGEKVPDIVMNDLKGSTKKLSDLKGQVVLVDFWASWCKPCRKENPGIVKVYNEYKNTEFKNGQGFTVFSVSLDSKKTAWENAVEKDGLVWDNHVSDLKGWKNDAAKLYGIRSLPHSYLIDGEGTIIAVNPRGSQLEKELKKFKKSTSWWSSWF